MGIRCYKGGVCGYDRGWYCGSVEGGEDGIGECEWDGKLLMMSKACVVDAPEEKKQVGVWEAQVGWVGCIRQFLSFSGDYLRHGFLPLTTLRYLTYAAVFAFLLINCTVQMH